MSYSVLISVVIVSNIQQCHCTFGAKAQHFHRFPDELRLKCSQKRLFYDQSLKMVFQLVKTIPIVSSPCDTF